MNMDAQGFLNQHLRSIIRTNTNTQLFSMPYHQNAQLNINLNSLPKQLKKIFSELFNPNKLKIVFNALLPFQPKTNTPPSCNTLLTARIQSYRCFDCQIHPDSLLCENCFKNGNHLGHRYLQVKEEGNCDCGCKDIIKQEGFCTNHKGQEEIVQINSSEEFIFCLHIRQIFIWILKLFKINQEKDAENLLLHFINYLLDLNDQSLYYNKLTTKILFSQANPIVDHLFYLTLNVSEKSKLSQTLFNLFFKMLPLRDFKERLLTSLIHNYNKLQHFQSSKYVKLFFPLLNQTQIVVSAMDKNPIPLRPQRPFSIQSFYFHLGMIKDIKPEAACAFLAPLLIVDAISFPFLQKVQQNCEKMNNLIVTVFPEFEKEETGYYKLLMTIIRVVEDKVILAAMIKNYFKMAQQYSFKKNKIILVPQRILVLLIYKYFDFNIQLIDPHQLASILQLTPQQLDEFVCQTCLKFTECIFQFSCNLNRASYFQNYLALYAKQNSQIICIDYLAIKMLPTLTTKPSFHQIIRHIYRIDSSIRNHTTEDRIDLFKGRNICLKAIIQIIYSDRAQLIVTSLLGKQHPNLINTLTCLFQTIGQINSQELQLAGQLFNFKQLSRETIDNILHYDPIKKRYSPNSIDKSSRINLQLMISLLQTKFSKFVNKKCEWQGELGLSDEQERLKDILLNVQMLQFIVNSQIELVQDVEDYNLMIKELLRTLNFIKIAYFHQESEFNHLYLIVLDHVNSTYSQKEDEQSRKFLQEIDHILINSTHPQEKQQNRKETDKRKELLRLKKQQMMKNKKIKENQQKFIKHQHNQVENGEICLLCRQNSNLEQMCYVGKMRATSLLYDFMKVRRDDVIIKTCFHTVHFDCFVKMDKTKQSAFCPLCKSAINIVLPMQGAQKQLLQKISKRIQYVLMYLVSSNQSQSKEGLIFEAVCFLANVLIANLQTLSHINQKQKKLFKLIYNLIRYNMGFQNKYERAQAILRNFVEKCADEFKIRCYSKLVQLIFHLSSWNLNNSTESIDTSLTIANQLSLQFGSQTVGEVLNIINYVASLPLVSQLQPIIIQFHNLQQIKPKQQITFFNFWTPPPTVQDLLKLRHKNSELCKIGHQICVCVICHHFCCLNCKKTNEHIRSMHPKECLFFNTSTGGFFYFYKGVELALRCIYVNDLQKVWKAQLKGDNFMLDKRLYEQMIDELKAANLFTYVINTLEGLKGGNISDRI